jgi:hypothetical protein
MFLRVPAGLCQIKSGQHFLQDAEHLIVKIFPCGTVSGAKYIAARGGCFFKST